VSKVMETLPAGVR